MKVLKIFTLLSIISALFMFSACKEDGIIDEVTFKVTVINNTANELTVFWNIDNGGFLEAGKVAPNGGTFEVKPVTINTDNEIEVREDDGTVVASGSYNQPDDTDRTLTVD
jgi:hypothetical protein